MISERSGQRIDNGCLPRKKKARHWRTRKDPFAAVWESEILPLHGPDKEVMFRQCKEPGRLGLSVFTEITVSGKPLSHRLYHLRLPYSGWSFINVILGGESYTALAESLQEALQRLSGAPREHRTDSLSAVYKNRTNSEQEDLTARYRSVCAHYGMKPIRNNRGVSHENGTVESPHGHIKKRISQALLLRESNDFGSVDDYRQWLDGQVQHFNRRCGEALGSCVASCWICRCIAPSITASRSSR